MNKLIIILLIFSTSLVLAQNASKFIAKATNEIRNHNYEKALIYLDKAIEISPTNINALVKRGAVYESLKRFNEAITDYSLAVDNGYEISMLNIRRAACYYQTNQHQEALTELNTLISKQTSFESLLLRGAVNERLGNYEEAIIDLNAAEKLSSSKKYKNIDNLHVTRYFAYFKLKKYEEAMIECNYLINNYPTVGKGFSFRGDVYKNKKEYSLAIADYSKAIELHNKDLYSFNGRAYCYKKNKRYDESLADYYQVLEIDTNNQTALSFIPEVKTYLKDYEGALIDCENYLTKFDSNDTRNISVRISKAIALKHLDRLDEAMQIFNQLIEENPKDEVIYNQRADLGLYTNKYNEALLDANKAIMLNPEYITCRITKAEILYKLEKYIEMCESFNKAIELGYPNDREEFNYINKKCSEN